MKAKKLVLLLDAIIIAIVTMAMLSGTAITKLGLNAKNKMLAENSDLSFNLIADPEETRVKAGATVDITLSAKDIKIGKEGLNSIVGYLSYDESLFDSVEINAEKDWNIELNRRKGHSMYGKFCIYTMQEGVTEDQVVVRMKMKLKDDLKPQTTKVYFTELASSDGEVEVPEEDRVVTIIIYEDGVPEDKKDPPVPVKTVDNKILVVIAIAILTIILNILTFAKNKKAKVVGTILVAMLGLSSLGIATYAAEGEINVAEVLNRLSYRESWLNSEKYLVTAENISRVAPGTKVEAIKNQFNKNVVITKNGQEVADGTVLGTGMKVSVKNPSKADAEGDYAYELSVYGDTNGDGKSNQVELTRIIRNTVDEEKWNLTGVKKISADLTVDNKVDEKDVNPSVMYIVYGEMEIPEFDPVEEPTIEVIEGTFDEEDNCYTTDVKVKITEKAENGIKTQYKVENSKGMVTEYTEISREVTEDGKIETIIELPKDEIYKVSAYTTGELGNRSGIPYLIVNGVFNNLRQYKVEYYYRSLENEETDTYKIDNSKTVEQYAEIGSEITTYEEKVKPGYEKATEKGTNGVEGLPLTINRNETNNVIKVYYKLHHYSITYDPNGGTWPNGGNPNPGEYTIETPIITVIDPGRVGYEITGWTEEEGQTPVKPYKIQTGKTGDIEIKAQWTPIVYRITYNGITDEERAALNNPTTYTIEDEKIINNPEDRETETFEGWSGTDLTGNENKAVKIERGSIGNREYTAHWVEKPAEPHTVTAEVVGGHGTVAPTSQVVDHGANVNNLEVTPEDGYMVSRAMVYSGPKDESRTYDPENDTDGTQLRAGRKGSNGKIKLATINNITEDKHVVVKLKVSDSDVIAMIIAVPSDNETLANLASDVDGEPILNHEYETLEDALIDALKTNEKRDELGLTGKVKILILTDIDGENNRVTTTTNPATDNEVIIDLNGKTVSSSDSESATIEVQDGASLQIVDESRAQTGTLKNTQGEAIKVNEGAELTLGEDAEGQEPSIESPRIEGKTNGIKFARDEDTIFNFYDGIIVGNEGTPISGKSTVDATPAHYVAYSTEDPDDNTVSLEYLAVPVDIVAMIGTNEYGTIEAAFAAADLMDNTNPIEIDLIRDTSLNAQSKDEIITIGSDKNYILDLNGHTLSNIYNFNSFINEGNFTIKDSTAINVESNKLSELQHEEGSNYYFEQVGNTLRLKTANNAEVNADNIYHSYAEIDLTRVSADTTKYIDISAYKEYANNLKFAVTEDETMPEDYDSIENRIDASTETYRFPLEGGKKYYLHILSKCNAVLYSPVVTDIRLDGKPVIKELSSTNGKISTNSGLDTIVNLKGANLELKNVYLAGKTPINSTARRIKNFGNVKIENCIIDGLISNNRKTIDDNYEFGEPATLEVKNSVLNASINGPAQTANQPTTKLKITDNTFLIGSVAATEGEIEDFESRGYSYRAVGALSDTIVGGITCDKLTAKNCIVGGGYASQSSTNTYVGKVTCYTGTIDNVKAHLFNLGNSSSAAFTAEPTDEVIIKNSRAYKYTGSGNSGQLNINDVKATVENSTFGVVNARGIVDFRNSTATGLSVYNIFNMHNSTINGAVGVLMMWSGEEAQSAGKFNMYDGTVKGRISTHRNKTAVTENTNFNGLEPEIVLGKKNSGTDNTISTETPKVEYVYSGTSLAAYAIDCTEGKLKFYDGQIIADKDYGIIGSNIELEEGTRLNIEDTIRMDGANPIDSHRITLTNNKPAARIAKSSGITIPSGINKTEDSEYYIFFNLDDAVASCPANASNPTTIEIMETLLITNKTHISSNRNVTIDLKGFKLEYITPEEAILVDEGSTLTIDNSTEEVGEIFNNTSDTTIINNGKFVVSNGKIILKVSSLTEIINNKEFEMNGGSIVPNNVNTLESLKNTGTLTVNNGELKVNIYNTDNGNMVVKGGKVSNSSYSSIKIYNQDNAKIKVEGGSVYGNIVNESETDYAVQVTGGTIEKGITSATTSAVKISGTIDESSHYTTVVKGLDIKGYADIDTANVSGILITDNYAKINNSGISGIIKNTTENTTTINNSSFSNFYLKGTGKTTITDSTVAGTGYSDYLYNQESADTTITFTNGSTRVFRKIRNEDNAKLTIQNGRADGSTIYNSSTNDVKLINTKPVLTNNNGYANFAVSNSGAGNIYIDDDCIISVSSSNSTAIQNSGAGNVYIGEADNALSTEKPKVLATSYAAQNTGSGKIVFNNGILVGNINGATNGAIEPRAGYSIIDYEEYEDTTKQAKILGRVSIASISQSEANVTGIAADKYELKNGNYEFIDLKDAIQACNANGTIKIIAEAQIASTANAITTDAADKITLDLNGHILTINKENYITNNGELNIIDSSAENAGKLITTVPGLITNNKILKLDDAVIEINTVNEQENIKTIITNNTGSTFNIVNNGIIQCANGKKYVKMIDNKGTVNIDNSKLLAKEYYTTLLENEGKVNITNNSRLDGIGSLDDGTDLSIVNKGEMTVDSSTLYGTRITNNDDGTLEIADSTYTGGLINNSTKVKSTNSKPAVEIRGTKMNVYVNNPTYRHRYSITNNSGQMIFKNSSNNEVQVSTLYSSAESLCSSITNNGGIITIESGYIAEELINEAGTIELIDGEISGKLTNKAGATLKILGGKVNNEIRRYNGIDNVSNGVGSEIRRETCGIDNSGELIIGNNSNAINKDIPEISLPTGTFKNNDGATFKFYDGRFTIKEEFTGMLDEIPANSSVIHTVGENTHTYQISSDTVVAKIGNTNYYTLASAFDACRDNTQETIVMQESIVLPQGATFEIGANKNIVLDLNNKNIKSNSRTDLFTNNGTFEITDSSTEKGGLINIYGDVLITNNKTFKLSGGELTILGTKNHTTKIIVLNNDPGTVEMTGGTIKIDGCEFKTTGGYAGYAIKGKSKGQVKLSGGKVIRGNAGYFVCIQSDDYNNKVPITIEGDFNVEQDANSSVNGNWLNTEDYTNINVNMIMTGGNINQPIYIQKSTFKMTGGTVSTLADIVTVNGTTYTDRSSIITIDGVDAHVNTLTVHSKLYAYSGTIDKLESAGSLHYPSSVQTIVVFRAETEIDGSKGDNPTSKVNIGTYDARTSNDTVKNANINNVILSNQADVTFKNGVKVEGERYKPSGSTPTNYGTVAVNNGILRITENDTIITSTNGIGLTIGYNGTNYNGQVILGSDDDNIISKEAPVITGETGGISLIKGTLYWNDGVAICSNASNTSMAYTKTTSGNLVVPERVQGYYDVRTENNGKKAFIGPDTSVTVVAKIGDTNYGSLTGNNGAVNAIATSATHTGTIDMFSPVALQEQLVIPAGCNITIDLHGNGIGVSNTLPLIKVESGATLTIKDSDSEKKGRIENRSGVVIENNGTLNVEISNDSIVPKEGEQAIIGTGTVNYNNN